MYLTKEQIQKIASWKRDVFLKCNEEDGGGFIEVLLTEEAMKSHRSLVLDADGEVISDLNEHL